MTMIIMMMVAVMVSDATTGFSGDSGGNGDSDKYCIHKYEY